MFSKKGELLLELGIKNFSLNDGAYNISYISSLTTLKSEYYSKILFCNKDDFDLINKIELVNLFLITKVHSNGYLNGYLNVTPIFKIDRSIFFMSDFKENYKDKLFYFKSKINISLPIFVFDSINIYNKEYHRLSFSRSNEPYMEIFEQELNTLICIIEIKIEKILCEQKMII